MSPIADRKHVETLQPIWTQRAAAVEPVTGSPTMVFRHLHNAGRRPALLHSGNPTAPGNRWSVIALDPVRVFQVDQHEPLDPFARLKHELSTCTLGGNARLPLPFVGGWIGYFSYDLAHRVERLRTSARVDHGFPLIEFAFYHRVLAYDHERAIWTACELIDPNVSPTPVRETLERLLDDAVAGTTVEREHAPALNGRIESNMTRNTYERAVERALEYIAAGDIYQVNLAQRFEGRRAIPPEELALRLIEASPAPFATCLQFGQRAIISSSPERFLLVREREVETWPIKGTRPRGHTPEEDERLKTELLASPKEGAELVMITDLLRNDLGRVCEYGSVHVPELRAVASYQNVHHTYSRVAGHLRDGVGLADLLRATLPGGSVTGAPKIRAMEIIEELEPTARGPYCGAIGWIGLDGSMDLSIAIRTMLIDGDRLTFHVGSGIVADSDPAAEYDETLHKAQGILRALAC